MWNSVVKGLSFDSYLNEIKEDLLIDIDNPSNGVSRKTIKRLSSGQKIILLSFANIINDAVERTLVIIDEPELFLHPPLITAYVRELSKILKKLTAYVWFPHTPHLSFKNYLKNVCIFCHENLMKLV